MQKAQVQAAVEQLRAQGERISQNAVLKQLGHGSKRDVARLLKEVLNERDENTPGTVPAPPPGEDGTAPFLVEVRRELTGAERTYQPGEVVNASTWKKLPHLLRQKWVVACDPAQPLPDVLTTTSPVSSPTPTDSTPAPTPVSPPPPGMRPLPAVPPPTSPHPPSVPTGTPGQGPGLWVRVRRPLTSGNKAHAIGDIVDVSRWNPTRVKQMLEQGWFTLYEAPPPPLSDTERQDRLALAQGELAQLEAEHQTHTTLLARFMAEQVEVEPAYRDAARAYAVAASVYQGSLFNCDRDLLMNTDNSNHVQFQEEWASAGRVWRGWFERYRTVNTHIGEETEALEGLDRELRLAQRTVWLCDHAPDILQEMDRLAKAHLRPVDTREEYELRESAKAIEKRAWDLYAAAHDQSAAD